MEQIRRRINDGISIHALREEGDQIDLLQPPARTHFYPRPPRGGRPWWPFPQCSWVYFYPRPPRGGRHMLLFANYQTIVISIHALREEGDQAAALLHGKADAISIHALREEGDALMSANNVTPEISIHALREEGDVFANLGEQAILKFLSTPSARRATRTRRPSLNTKGDFYPRPPRGGRRDGLHHHFHRTNFYPRPPRGGRHVRAGLFCSYGRFLSTPSARRATPGNSAPP